ncbi:MRC1-like domain-containing protein [Elsinoe ampelina]|uniref:MRC1-like domain-containing protein n=1 Tax=Elsinoe ampelina TaxID=302913 RepID=A0A6A6GFD1_9PEZI|nr:MRC1-like domain-containing protein [Elsinoe ampelina]
MPSLDSDMDDQSPVRPIGRIASRMVGSPTRSEDSEPEFRHSPVRIGKRIFQESDEEEEQEADDAADIYAAMKAKLMGQKPVVEEKAQKQVTTLRSPKSSAAESSSRPSSPAPKSSAPQSLSPTTSDNGSHASGSDSDAPVVSKKRSRNAVFLSDSESEKDGPTASDSNAPAPPAGNRFKQLLAQKRAEREKLEEQERIEAEQRAQQEKEKTAQFNLSDLFDDDEVTRDQDAAEEDSTIDDKLTQQARPTRKASRKAIEDMNKETQRMSRNMQLTHQAKVKKKFSIADFAAKFKKQSIPPPACAQSSAAPSSDVEKDKDVETPPSSPPSEGVAPDLGKTIFAVRSATALDGGGEDEPDLPRLEEILSQSLLGKGKGKASASNPIEPSNPPAAEAPTKPPKKRLSPKKYRIHNLAPRSSSPIGGDSDDDLEIIKDRLAVFSKIVPKKANESAAVHHLRVLAGLNGQESAPSRKGKKNIRPSMTSGQLDVQLRRRAALQVKQEREEKIAELRAKGIIVQTAEERERDMMEIEDLLEKARREAEELKKKEKEERKEEGGEVSDDESDEEWMEGKEEEEAASGEEDNDEEEDLEASGSEEEDEDEDEEEVEEVQKNALVDDVADEADDESEEDAGERRKDYDDAEMDDSLSGADFDRAPKPRAARKKFIVDDDEDDEVTEAVVASSQPPQDESPAQSDDLAAAFGFVAAPRALMSPSQMFAGTMAASQSQLDRPFNNQSQEQDSMDIFNAMVPSMPTPEMPRDDTQATVYDERMIHDSLPDTQTPRVQLDLTQGNTQSPAISRLSQMSAWPSPSQDVGFGYRESPLAHAARPPQSTIDTVLLSVPESPVQPRRGRLQRRAIADEESVNGEDDSPAPATMPAPEAKKTTAFDVMKRAATKPVIDFDKKKSGAKEMIDEQASESDDEYAGLGGASDDDADGSGDEADKAMIDTSDIKVDERKLAAYYAEKSRAENEAQTSRLYKDLMSGALRRRGDAFDLDSDEDEQIAERRRRKQREEARKRRLLLGDEKLGKLGESGKKEAFLRAIEDRDEEDGDVDMLDGRDPDASFSGEADTASQDPSTQPPSQDTLQPVSGNALKRKADDQIREVFKRPAFSARRTTNAAFTKPSNLAEVRETVSFLVDEPHGEERPVDLSDDEEGPAPDTNDDVTPAEPHPRAPFSARRTPAKPAVVNRLLSRQSSSSSSSASTATDQAGAGMAFLRTSTSSFSGFKVPSLLRRATTSTSTTAGGRGSMGPPALKKDASTGSAGTGRKQGSGKSSINYAAREAERRAVVEGVERRRREDVRRIAGMRKVGGTGGRGFGGGFE